MLVVNSAYKTDTAFQFTVSNLCPNTYYEISAWLKNICYKCGCDSNGVSATNPGTTYIPSALNDSSGVQPNLTFDINGVDYYTTGNIGYGGLFPSTQTGSDSNNTWVKRGFTYLTAVAQTSLKLTIRNNAPGGGGNDWAMDDITVATCLPTMSYSPSNNPTICTANPFMISDTVRSIYNTYKEYKWQRSTDGGATWTDVTSAATGTPVFNGSQYEFVTNYTIPPGWTTLANSGDVYRVIVSSTASNLTNANCVYSDGVANITVNVINCAPVLDVRFLSFAGRVQNGRALLNWSTSKEDGAVSFEIEKSSNGTDFYKVATATGYGSLSATNNHYNYYDTSYLQHKAYFRITLLTGTGRRIQSQTIILGSDKEEFSVSALVNPVYDFVAFDLTTSLAAPVEMALLDEIGHVLKTKTFVVHTGLSKLYLNIDEMASGIYIMRVQQNDKTVTKKLIKK
jgi:hypothetical protein